MRRRTADVLIRVLTNAMRNNAFLTEADIDETVDGMIAEIEAKRASLKIELQAHDSCKEHEYVPGHYYQHYETFHFESWCKHCKKHVHEVAIKFDLRPDWAKNATKIHRNRILL